VHGRIAEFVLEAPAGSVPTPYHAWARQQASFTVPPNSPADTVLMFYDQLFKGWRRLDRTTDDGIWLDPSGTVLAWAYCLGANAYVSLTDLDRGIWYQRSRRTSNGDRIVDLASEIRRTLRSRPKALDRP
jgi:hypothetical protein